MSATKAERERMRAVKELPCIICGHPPPSDCQHITDCGRRMGHMFTIPLCYEHHRGDKGLSGKDCDWDKSTTNQLKLLEKVNQILEDKERDESIF